MMAKLAPASVAGITPPGKEGVNPPTPLWTTGVNELPLAAAIAGAISSDVGCAWAEAACVGAP